MADRIPTGDQRAIIARLNRAQGQLAAVGRMIESGRDCEDIVGQLAAVGKAVDSIAFTIAFANLRQCLLDGREDADVFSARMQKLLVALA